MQHERKQRCIISWRTISMKVISLLLGMATVLKCWQRDYVPTRISTGSPVSLHLHFPLFTFLFHEKPTTVTRRTFTEHSPIDLRVHFPACLFFPYLCPNQTAPLWSAYGKMMEALSLEQMRKHRSCRNRKTQNDIRTERNSVFYALPNLLTQNTLRSSTADDSVT